MVVFEAVILAGALGPCVGYKLEDNPLHLCQSKKRGETPEGYTNETFQETPSECIYFCKPFDDGQWYIGKIEDDTACEGKGVHGKCKSGYCVIAGNEQIPPNGIEPEKPGPLPPVAAPSNGEVGGTEAPAPGPSDNTEIGGAEMTSTAGDTENEEPSTVSSGGDQLNENGPPTPPGELTPTDEEPAPAGSEVKEESSTVGQPSDDDDDEDDEEAEEEI
uniref:Putative secreted mucin n=1 Tax=Amblyomma triste TaxID=251400 RepID=A0A023GB19_AMBTT